MARIRIEDRLATIEGPGTLYVSSDLHGNLEDFHRMIELFESEENSALLLLGDLFHGPSVTREEWAILYEHLADYYPDESAQLFREFAALRLKYPDRVASLMGNHDHAHVGGPVVSKFYMDEAGAMEDTMDPNELPKLHDLIRTLPLIAVSDCGIAFTHGAPPDMEFDRDTLADLPLEGYENVPLFAMHSYNLLGALLWRRGSPVDITSRFLDRLSAFTEPPSKVVVHGHEIVDAGFEVEHMRMLNLSTSFGMKHPAKTYLRLDLSRTYTAAWELLPGRELLPLYDPQP